MISDNKTCAGVNTGPPETPCRQATKEGRIHMALKIKMSLQPPQQAATDPIIYTQTVCG